MGHALYHITVAAQARHRSFAVALLGLNRVALSGALRASSAGSVTRPRTRQRLGFCVVARVLGTHFETLVVLDRLRLHRIGAARERLDGLAVHHAAIEIATFLMFGGKRFLARRNRLLRRG